MDISSIDYNGPSLANLDMEILASMTNTDLLIRLIKDQAEETAALRNQLASLNSSAMQMKHCYTTEKKKHDRIESENQQLQSRVKTMEAKISLLDNSLLNSAAIHEQRTAELENQLVTASRQIISQRNILKANHLSSKDLHQHYTNAKEFLRRRDEIVVEDMKDVKISSKKKKPAAMVDASTMTDERDKLKSKVEKTFCDKSTMHSPMVSTTTRGTTTSTFIKKVDVATNFPDPIAIEVDEIFRIMIDDMPPAITPIADLPLKSTCSQTEPQSQLNCSVGTMTRIRNVRRQINYATDHPQSSSPTSNPLYRVKKEKVDDILLNLDYPNQTIGGTPINRELTHLWQMLGQMIFTIIGTGEVFNHSNNMNLINDNLNQIRRVIEIETQPEAQFQHIDDSVEEPLHNDFTVGVNVAGLGVPNTPNNVCSNVTVASSSGNVKSAHNVHPDELSTSSLMETNPPPISQNKSTTLIINKSAAANRVPIAIDSSDNTTDSSVQCEADNVFKKPTSAKKRKQSTENCMIRKRTCQRKMVTNQRSSQVESTIVSKSSTSVSETFNTSTDGAELSTLDDPDSALVEDILRYFKMPAFIEPIEDSALVIEAMERLRKVEECTLNAQNLEVITPDSMSIDSEAMDSTSIDMMPSDSSASTEPETMKLSEYTGTKSIDRDLVDLKSTDDVLTYDEFESPASPPPFEDIAASYQEPSIIPTSPKTLGNSIVKDILTHFDKPKRLAVKQRKFKVPNVKEEQILTSTRCRIEQYLISEWTSNEIEICCNDLTTVRPSILSKCFVEVVTNTKDEKLSREFTPPAPSLPQTHQKIIVLIKRIGQLVKGFEDLLLFQLEKTMFVLADDKTTVTEKLNLTYLFIGLSDCMDEESKWSCVMFVYKCLYYFATKAIPMVYSVLMAYPSILPKFKDDEDPVDSLKYSTNILQATLAIVLINTNLTEVDTGKAARGMKKRDLYTFLKTYYHFPPMKPTIDDFVDILINRLANSTSNLENISYSLILIAKRNGTVWADDMVQRKLLPQLNRFLVTTSDGMENDQRVAILVSAISSIIKTFPVTKDISHYQQIFFKVLDLTTRQTIQEEAVMALLRTSRFGMVNVYKRICDWRPQTRVSRQCYAMLSTFLYRQNLNYWQNV